MASYIVHLYQSGGCDYTIGCGTVVCALEADTYTEALEEVEDLFDEEYDLTLISSATIYEVKSQGSFDVDGLRARKRAERKAEIAQAREAKERADYERLKSRYEGGE